MCNISFAPARNQRKSLERKEINARRRFGKAKSVLAAMYLVNDEFLLRESRITIHEIQPVPNRLIFRRIRPI